MSRFRAFGARALPFAVLLAVSAVAPATAQLMLPPQSVPPAPSPARSSPSGAPPAQPGSATPRPQAVSPPKVVGEATVIGKQLAFNGTKGRLVIDRKDKAALSITLIAVGEKLSRPGEACGVDLGNGRPLDLTPAGRPLGVARYTVSIPACTMDVDMLDGAVLVSGPGALCPLPEADCKVDAQGLWGPGPGTLESQLKGIESERARADRAVRDNFKALLARTDRKQVKTVAAEQAGFTSERETLCRDYARESVHGFCSARFTELRAAELANRVAALGGPPPPKPQRPRPAAPATAPASAGAAPPPPAAEPAPPPPRPAPKTIFDIFR